MSTRCNVILHDRSRKPKAILYHHSDGYPENIVPKLNTLMSKAKTVLDKRYYRSDDPEKLASMLVVLSVDDNGIPTFKPCLSRHCDIEYLYRVFLDESGEPEVVADAVVPSMIRDFMGQLADDDDLKKCLLEEMACSEHSQASSKQVEPESCPS